MAMVRVRVRVRIPHHGIVVHEAPRGDEVGVEAWRDSVIVVHARGAVSLVVAEAQVQRLRSFVRVFRRNACAV